MAASAAAVFTVVYSILLWPLAVPEADRIVMCADQFRTLDPNFSLLTNARSYFDRPRAVSRVDDQAMFRITRRAIILDASGYVVARRQATVSSKITGKVVQVFIEEGRRVARDEIIARLDDTNARAALEQARAARAQSEANLAAAQVAFDNAAPTFKR